MWILYEPPIQDELVNSWIVLSVVTMALLLGNAYLGELDLSRATMLGVSESAALVIGGKFNLTVLKIGT